MIVNLVLAFTVWLWCVYYLGFVETFESVMFCSKSESSFLHMHSFSFTFLFYTFSTRVKQCHIVHRSQKFWSFSSVGFFFAQVGHVYWPIVKFTDSFGISKVLVYLTKNFYSDAEPFAARFHIAFISLLSLSLCSLLTNSLHLFKCIKINFYQLFSWIWVTFSCFCACLMIIG